MRNALVAAMVAGLALALAACGAYHFPSASPAGTGTVTGHVFVVPCGPVESPDMPCKGQPVPGIELDFTAAGGSFAITKTDSNGYYSIELDAGTWSVSLKGFGRMISGPRSVTVTADATTVANYVMDSGIRAPVTGPGVAAPASAKPVVTGPN